jgi:hypothetical protein
LIPGWRKIAIALIDRWQVDFESMPVIFNSVATATNTDSGVLQQETSEPNIAE